jgi:trans-aconitate methyltransferase
MAESIAFDRRAHWENIYRSKSPSEVSWYQASPSISLQLIEASAIDHGDAIIDVGGGASVLVDHLLDRGYQSIAVLDVSSAAQAHAKSRLGARAQRVEWYEEDVTRFRPDQQFALWHDRAVFHFLTDAAERARYVKTLRLALKPRGHAILATFAMDGPTKCSGLEIVRYGEDQMRRALGDEFELREQVDETHLTPWKSEQRFSYFRFQRRAEG